MKPTLIALGLLWLTPALAAPPPAAKGAAADRAQAPAPGKATTAKRTPLAASGKRTLCPKPFFCEIGRTTLQFNPTGKLKQTGGGHFECLYEAKKTARLRDLLVRRCSAARVDLARCRKLPTGFKVAGLQVQSKPKKKSGKRRRRNRRPICTVVAQVKLSR